MEYVHNNGFHAGAYISQYNFGYDDNGTEIDIYVAYCFNLNDSFCLDTSITNYQNTGEPDSPVEWKTGIGHAVFKVNYHRDQNLDTDYFEFNPSYSFTNNWVISDDEYERNYDYSLTLGYICSEQFELIIGYSDHE